MKRQPRDGDGTVAGTSPTCGRRHAAARKVPGRGDVDGVLRAGRRVEVSRHRPRRRGVEHRRAARRPGARAAGARRRAGPRRAPRRRPGGGAPVLRHPRHDAHRRRRGRGAGAAAPGIRRPCGPAGSPPRRTCAGSRWSPGGPRSGCAPRCRSSGARRSARSPVPPPCSTSPTGRPCGSARRTSPSGNIDLTAHLFTQPRGDWLGFDTTVSFGPHGVGLTSSVSHDLGGPIGTVAQVLTVRP